MAGFDEEAIFFSDNFGTADDTNILQSTFRNVKRQFKDFLRKFHEGNFNYKYRYRVIFRNHVMFSTPIYAMCLITNSQNVCCM